MEIELTTSPAVADAEVISRGLVNFNHRLVETLESPAGAVGFSVFAREAAGEARGELGATFFRKTPHVELPWVSAAARGTGTRSEFLAQAGRFAVERGRELALTETTSLQSRPFCEQFGDRLPATLSDYPEGHARHFMTRRLADAETATVTGAGAP
jgi:hypothetical protein